MSRWGGLVSPTSGSPLRCLPASLSSSSSPARVSGRGPSLLRAAAGQVSGWSTMDTRRPPRRLHDLSLEKGLMPQHLRQNLNYRG